MGLYCFNVHTFAKKTTLTAGSIGREALHCSHGGSAPVSTQRVAPRARARCFDEELKHSRISIATLLCPNGMF